MKYSIGTIKNAILRYRNIINANIELRYIDDECILYVIEPYEDIDGYSEEITIDDIEKFIDIEKRQEKILKLKENIWNSQKNY